MYIGQGRWTEMNGEKWVSRWLGIGHDVIDGDMLLLAEYWQHKHGSHSHLVK